MSFFLSWFTSAEETKNEGNITVEKVEKREAMQVVESALGNPDAITGPVEEKEMVEIKEIKKDLLDECNQKWFTPNGYILTKESDICYRLRNPNIGETYLIHVVPYCYPNSDVTYRLGIKEVFYPHIKKFDAFKRRMEIRNIPVSPMDLNTLKIGESIEPVKQLTWTSVVSGLNIPSDKPSILDFNLIGKKKDIFYMRVVDGKIILSA